MIARSCWAVCVSSALWSGAAEAGGVTEVVTVRGAHVQRPSWSPDGSQLAYEVNDQQAKQIHLFVGDGSGPGTRVSPPARARSSLTKGFETSVREGTVHEIAWSPPAVGAYAYSATNVEDDYDLYIGDAAVVRSPGADGGATWSPDGRHLVFASARSGDGDLYVLDVVRIEEPPRPLTSIPRASELHASWSPDSKQVVFVAHSSTGDNLWWVPALDATPEKLTTTPGSQLHPRFSPDGQRIAFYASNPESETFGLYVMEARPGARAAPLLPRVVVDSHGPAWLDETSIVAVADEDAAFDPLVRVTLDGVRSTLPIETVGNRDLALGHDGATVRLAWCAQGRKDGLQRDFRRLYTTTLSPP